MTGVVAWTSTAAGASTPVPLLGNQSVAATHDGGSGTSEAFGYTAGATGTATSAGVYLDTTDGVRVGLYADQSGRPGVRLDQGSTTVNTAGWVTVSLPAGVHIVKGTRYWIVIAGTRGGGTVGYRDAGSSGSTLDFSGNGMATPYSVQQQWNSNPASVYIAGNAATPPVAPSNSVAPTITGTAQQGQTLTDGPGTWAGTAPITYTYQWQRNATNISGATSSTYTLSAADVGATVDVTVRATNAGGSASASSAPTARVSGLTPTAPVNTTLQVVTGTDTQGQTLATTNGTWSGSPTSYAYQWRDCDTSGNSCTSVTGANSSSYVLAGSDVGHTMRLVLTATNSSGSTPATSLATGVVGTAGSAPTNLSPGTLSGTDTQGQTLTTTNGSWTGSPTAYTYQWQDCDGGGANCADVAGATSVSYLLGSGDVGHTVRVVVSASNASGSATAASAASATVSATGGGGLPAGVTLKPIDGGPNYYCSHGLTYACNAGWDNPSFFPIGAYYGTFANGQADVNRWKDLGLNTAFQAIAPTDTSLLRANGISLISQSSGTSGPENSPLGSETVGLSAYDEPSTMTQLQQGIKSTPCAQQTGRFWWQNNTWNFIAYGGIDPLGTSQQTLAATAATPCGNQRGVDIPSVDIYWFANLAAGGDYQCGKIYQLSGDCTSDQEARGSHYGDVIDDVRSYETPTASKPILSFVENGGPLLEDTTAASYIQPPEMNWAVWSSIIHGARMISYFNHSFAGPANGSQDNFANSYFQTLQNGQSISIYDQAKATDGLIAQLAPEINSPTALGYVTTNQPPTTLSGIDTMAKYTGSSFYVFASTRDSEAARNISPTFTTADHYSGPVTVVGENRVVQSTNGVFTDTFAKGSTIHIYQIP